MPNLLETASKLDNMLNAGWNNETPISTDNVPYQQILGQSYLETKFIIYTSRNVTVGSSFCERKRTEGVLFTKIRTPIDEGIGLAYDYADNIRSIMDNKNPLPDMFTYVSSVRRSGDEDGWYVIIIDTPFLSDEA